MGERRQTATETIVVATREGAIELRYSGEVSATLVPASSAPAGVGLVFLHWGFGDRRTFLSEARAFARAGAQSLLLDAPGFGGRGRGLPKLGDAAVAEPFLRQIVDDAQRGVDVLLAHGTDPARVGLVGHSLGATIAAHLLAEDERIRAAVLMAGTGEASRLWSFRPTAEYLARMAPLDGVNFIGKTKSRVFFQFGERDEWVGRGEAKRYTSALPSATVAYYNADHRLDDRATRERAEFLSKELGFSAPATAGVRLPWRDVAKYFLAKPMVKLMRKT